MKDFFLYTLFEIQDYNFKIIHVLFILIVVVITYFSNLLLEKYIKKLIGEKEFTIEGSKITIIRLVRQVVYIIALIATLKLLSFYNPKFDLFDLLTIELVSIKNFHFSFYHIFLIIAIIFGVRIGINIIKLSLKRAAKKTETLDPSTQYTLIQLAKYIIYTFSVLFLIRSMGVDLSLLLTGSVGLLVGVGLGLQDFFRDLISGLILLFEGSIKVDDIIEMQSSPEATVLVAKVLKINMRTTKIETREGNCMIVPNSKLTQDFVHNWSFGTPLSRFHIDIKVHFGVDTELVKELLIKAAKSHPKVDKKEPVFVRLLNFGQDGLEMDLVFYADQSWRIEIVKSDIRFEIDRLFRENGFKIPYQQRTIHYQPTAEIKK